jgi:hypothetical protein
MAKRSGPGVPTDSAGFGEEVMLSISTPVDVGKSDAPIDTSVEGIEEYVKSIGSDDIPTFGGTWVGGAGIQQIPDEIAPCLYAMLKSGERIDSYFELGVASGGMTKVMHHYFNPGTIVLVDTNEHARCKDRSQVLAEIKCIEIIGKSEDDHVLGRFLSLGYAYDAMMIDGVHYYLNVKKDVEKYAASLRNGGFLMLHDSALVQWGVPRLVAELKNDPAWEFVGEWNSKVMNPCGVALFQRVT